MESLLCFWLSHGLLQCEEPVVHTYEVVDSRCLVHFSRSASSDDEEVWVDVWSVLACMAERLDEVLG